MLVHIFVNKFPVQETCHPVNKLIKVLPCYKLSI